MRRAILPPFGALLPHFCRNSAAILRTALTRTAPPLRRDKMSRTLAERYGITEHQLRIAQREVVNRLLQYNKSLMSAFRSMDSDHSGVLYREEVTGRAIPGAILRAIRAQFSETPTAAAGARLHRARVGVRAER